MRATEDLRRGTIRGQVLALLSATPKSELHTREVVRRLSRSPRGVHVALEQLENEGLIRSRRLGRLRLWSVATGHPLYEPLRQILQRTLGIPARLSADLSKGGGLDVAFIFGSFVAGAQDAESDIDVFVLGKPDWRAIAKTTQALGREFGREINLIALTESEVSRALKDRSPFLETLRGDSKIWLIGDSDDFERILGELEEGLRGRRPGRQAQQRGRRKKTSAGREKSRPR